MKIRPLPLQRLLLGIALFFISAEAKKETPQPDPRIEGLKREIAALEQLKGEKLDLLERKEAARWQNRYKQNLESERWDEQNRQLEARYSRLSSDLSRLQEEVIKERERTEEAEQKWEEIEKGRRSFELLLSQEISKRAEGLSEDFPIGIAQRIEKLSRATAELEGDAKRIDRAIQLWYEDYSARVELTLRQSLSREVSYFSTSKSEFPVWRLQFGTLYTAELTREGAPQVQALLKTGALRGRTYAWRDDLDAAWSQSLRHSLNQAIEGEDLLPLPFDLMQNRGSGAGLRSGEGDSRWEQFKAWAEKGGVVMYPLALVVIFAFFLILERGVTLLRRRSRYRRLYKRVPDLLREGRRDEALAICGKGREGLSRTLVEMIRLHRNGSGELELVEQAIQRALVVEMPTLEKRMGLLATLGAVAPLLGLLGTVSGMITLFKVITEVGSNDARLLAGGISEALITTEAGLIIAIPILLIHGWLSERVEEITAILRTTILEVLNILWPGGEASSHQFIAELQKEMADHPDSQKHHHPEKEEEASG